MPKRMNKEEFIEKVKELVGDEYEFLEKYVNKTTKIKVRHNCKKCNNHEYLVRPKDFFKGTRCPACFGTHKKTTEQFKNELFDVVGDKYTVLGEYENSNSKILVRHNCNSCNNNEYLVRPIDILKGRRCPACFKTYKKTTEQFKEEVFNKVGNEYTILGEYTGAHKKIKIRHNCDKCENFEYETEAKSFLDGAKCPKCFGTFKKTTKEFKEDVKKLVADEYTVLGNYEGNKIKIKMRHNCENCNNNEFEMKPNCFLSGQRCPICAKTSRAQKRTKTQEQFEKDVFDLVGDEYTVIGKYIKNKEKVKFRHNCDKCNNNEFELSPDGFLNAGYRCPICSKVNSAEKRTKTQEQFEKEVSFAVGSEYEFLEDYKTAQTKIKVRHNSDRCNNYEFEMAPAYFLSSGYRCPKCADIINAEKRTKTQEQFEQDVFKAVGSEYEFLEDYKNSKIEILVRHNCISCNNYEYKVAPNHFLQGERCPKCAIVLRGLKSRKTHEQFVKEVKDLVDVEYTVLGKYENSDIKIKMRHNSNKCNNFEWFVDSRNFLSGSRCPKCSGKMQKNTDIFKEEVFKLVADEFTVLGEYETSNKKIKMRHNCDKCKNYEFFMQPKAFLHSGNRCPKCNEYRGEKAVANYLDLKNINYKIQYTIEDCKYKNVLRYDIGILDNDSDNNLLALIEYDGIQHFKPTGFGSKDIEKIKKAFEDTQKRDKIKDTYCENNNIPFLRIKYTEFKNIEEILDKFLKEQGIIEEICEEKGK